MRKFFSTQDVFTTRNLVVMALLAALTIILSQFNIYLTPNFRLIRLSYLPSVMVSMLYGPWAGIAFGFVADTLGYIARPAGPYFIGYALSEMVSNFIYAGFLYQKPLRLWRVVGARAVNLVVVLLGLNYLWSSMLSGASAGAFFTTARLVNNLLQFPLHVLLSAFSCKIALRLKDRQLVR